MESSIAAFSDSIEKYLKGYKEFKTQLDQGRVPIGKEFHDEIYKKISLDDDDATMMKHAFLTYSHSTR